MDQNFCNRDCYYSYCFRLAEELDCTADDIIDANYNSINGYISNDGSSSTMGHDTNIMPTDQSISSPTSYHQQAQAQTRCLQISRVH